MSAAANARLVTMLASALAGACDSPTEPNLEPTLPDVRRFVTGEALAHLDERGHFVLPPLGLTRRPAISSDDAERIALAYVARVSRASSLPNIPGFSVTSTKESLETGHGRPIEWERLRLGKRRPYIVHEYLEPLPDSVHPAAHNHFGPHYFVALQIEQRQVLTIAVAAYTPSFVDAEGRLRGFVGNDFRPLAVPYDRAFWHPLPPEVAVKQLVELVGAPVAGVPYLLQPGNGVVVTQAVWVLELQREVELRRLSDGLAVRSTTIYASQFPSITDYHAGKNMALRWFVAAEDQPHFERVWLPLSGELVWPIRAGVPVNFLEVVPAN
jgi:hypothetical protein